jgi:hypothetical protein
MVMLMPTNAVAAGAKWRFPWERGWRDSGTMVNGLLAGTNYPIQFRNAAGYLAIATNDSVSVTNGLTTYTKQYFPTVPVAGTGALTINIVSNPPAGAAWRFIGGTVWQTNGSTFANLAPDIYLIEFAPVSGFVWPGNIGVQVSAGQTNVVAVAYAPAPSVPTWNGNTVSLPVPVPTTPINLITDLTDFPYGFNGQLQSDVGYASGVAVQTNVVLTAAHVVFNDATLSYVSQANWYFEREAGLFEPAPMTARGWYVLSGYAAERNYDRAHGYGIDQSSAESRNLDVAVLYFNSPVSGGGFGGFLPSDIVPNPWLTGTGLKMLVGYPVDGSRFGDTNIAPGLMYETGQQPYPLTLVSDPVNEQQEVYTAPWFLSYPGNSGGPFYVQFNGYYYPAGVYLGDLDYGGSHLSAVRAIDSNVVTLITIAQATVGDSGTNYTGGGVVNFYLSQALATNGVTAYLQFQLGPPAAVLAGAAWTADGTNWSTSPDDVVAVTNAVTIAFRPIPGWNLPAGTNVAVTNGFLTYQVNYTQGVPTTLSLTPGVGLGIVGSTGTTYVLQYRTSLATGTWLPLLTYTIQSNGLNPVLALARTNLTNRATFYRAQWVP